MSSDGHDVAGTTSFNADGSVKTNDSWVRVQKKTFTRWMNSHLSDRMLKVEDLQNDLQDGILLANLLEIISDKNIGKWNAKPRFKLMMMENLNVSINFIQREGLKLVNVGSEDIYNCNLRIILGLIWTLILRYQINKGITEGSPKWLLLEWVKKQVKPYGVREPKDFKSSWIDGTVLSALCDSLEPGTFAKDKWTGDAMEDVTNAMKTATDEYDINQLMDPEDMVEYPDELSIMTYVAQYRDYAEKQAERLAYLRGIPNAEFTYIEGEGLESGKTDVPAEFKIFARNYQDDALTTGGHHFKVAVAGPNGEVDHNLTDNGDGTYDVSYTPKDAGAHEISVQISPKPDISLDKTPDSAEFTHVKNSPATSTIKASVDGSSCTAEGPGLEHPYTDAETNFTIVARNKDGDQVGEGGETFNVKLSGPSGDQDLTANDNGDGTYSVAYTPTEKGDHTVTVQHDDTDIQGSPFTVGVKPTVVASDSTAEGPGLVSDENINTKPTKFTVTARDKHGDQVPEGDSPFEVAITGPNGPVDAKVTDNGDGTYDVEYTPDDAGNHQIAVTLDGDAIKDMPQDVNIKPAVVTGNSTAEGPGVEGPCKVDKHGPVTIIARDEDGKQVAFGGFDFEIEVTGPNGPVDHDGIKDNEDGTYSTGWTPTHSGEHTVAITSEGQPIKDSPFTFTVAPNPDASQSYAEGDGLSKGFDNAPAHFKVHLKDKNGEPVVDGKPLVEIKGPADVEPKVTNNGDGTYDVEYEAEEAGDYEINVLTSSDGEGEPIKDMPTTAKIIEGADADNSRLGIFTFTVQSCNKKGEPKEYGGDDFEVFIKHRASKDAQEEGDVECEAIDNEDGTYTAKYKLEGQGRFSVNVKLNGKHVKGSPFRHKL
eukprot:CAMPEP_0201543964 /NCGR_PEP_ID=MMETSP0173_2-20130828/240_1 /ASSEMBLY_ACC=CAM_ASM_000268 /TAXON_ID=218659 /ORGANISM="Vexillifera sp., Strain DIVA3 564/2" /LENGTH=875 /DNA_ID=CAMNT_0047951895 /DNA_START=37 /DNA_END=2664 /DNA_ORIENTATION=-